MKTVKDLHLLYKQEIGLRVCTNLIGEGYEDPEYTKWLEENALRMLNKKSEYKSSFDRQMEARPKEVWKP